MSPLDPTGRPRASTTPRTAEEEEQTITRLSAELRACDAPLRLTLEAGQVFDLIVILQLAARHPHFADVVATVVDAGRAYFAGCPTILAVIDQGDDPAEGPPHDEE